MTHFIKYQVDDGEWKTVDLDLYLSHHASPYNIVSSVSDMMRDIPIARVTVATKDGTVIRFQDIS